MIRDVRLDKKSSDKQASSRLQSPPQLHQDYNNNYRSTGRAIDRPDPGPAKLALLVEIFAYNELSLDTLMPISISFVWVPLVGILIWGFLDSGAKHDVTKILVEVWIVGWAALKITAGSVFSALHRNIDTLHDRVYRGSSMFWCLQLFCQALALFVGVFSGTAFMPIYCFPEQTMTNAGWIEHVIVGYLMASVNVMMLLTLMFGSRGHEVGI